MATQRVKINAKPSVIAAQLDANFGSSLAKAGIRAMVIDWLNGTGPNQSDKFWCRKDLALANAATDSWDLTALTDGPDGATVNLAELRGTFIYVVSGTSLTVGVGAANGFEGYGANFEIVLKPGDYLWIPNGNNDVRVTDGTHKVLDFLAAGAVVYDVCFIGASA